MTVSLSCVTIAHTIHRSSRENRRLPFIDSVEVADFFSDLHSLDHVREDIASGNMGVLVEDGEIIGMGCFDGNHITGVYVLPAFQGKGCGPMIIDHLGSIIGKDHETAVLDVSLPAAAFYEHRGYRTVGHGVIDLEDDAKLVFGKMEKRLRYMRKVAFLG